MKPLIHLFHVIKNVLSKHIKQWMSIYTILMFTFAVTAQDVQKILNNAQGREYLQVVKEVEEMYKGKDKGKGTGYKQIQRWLDFQRTRLTKDGRIQNLTKVLLTESDKYDKAQAQRSSQQRLSALMAGANWTLLGGTSTVDLPVGYTSGVGRISIVVADPANNNILYAGTPAAGLWRSTNGGTSWTLLTAALPSIIGISGVAIDPSSPAANRTIYILTGDGDYNISQSVGIYKSTNNGVSWTASGLASEGNGRKLIIHPTNPNIVLAALHSGIYRSSNAGASWTNVLSTSTFYDVEFKPGDPNTVYAGGSGMVYRSTNAGASWSQLTSGLPVSGSRISIAVTPANPAYLYVLFGSATGPGTYGGVYLSTNSGTSFSLRSTTPNILGGSDLGDDSGDQAWYDLAMAVSPVNANEVHVGGINIWKSLNGGTSWALESSWNKPYAGAGNYTHADIHDLAFFGNVFLCGSDGGVYKSLNSGEDWVAISDGLEVNHIYRIASDRNHPDRTFCGLQDNGLNYITNKTLYCWFGADGMEIFPSTADPNKYFGSTQNGGLVKTSDGGQTVNGIRPGEAIGGLWITPFVIDPNNSSILYSGFQELFKSATEGSTWTDVTHGTAGSGTIDNITIDPSNSNHIIFSRGSSLYRSTNGGTSWTTVSNPGFVYPSRIEIDPRSTTTLLVIGYGVVYKVNLSTSAWTLISNGTLPNVPFNCLAKDKNSSLNALYLGTDLGVYYKDDSSPDWISFNDGLPKAVVSDMDIHYSTQTLRMGTVGRGSWKSPLYNTTGIAAQITSPATNTELFEGASLTLNATASTTTGSITKVEFYNKGIKIGEDLTSPYSLSLTNIAMGEYLFNAVAYNSGGSNSVSPEVVVNVWRLRNPENPASTVNGLNYKYYEGFWDLIPNFSSLTPVKTGNVTIFDIISNRNITDGYGFNFTGFIQVPTDGVYKFYTSSDDGSRLLIGTQAVVNNDGLHGPTESNGLIALKAGKHAITVDFFENGGDEALAVYYSGPGVAKQLIPASVLYRTTTTNTAPTAGITSPANNATFTAPASITINANASDADGTISKVEFFQGATKLGEDLTTPYSYNWTGVAAGTYSLTAVATDNGSLSTTSSPITVIVNATTSADICFETESGSAQSAFSPYQVLSDANASGGQYIVAPNGTGNQGSPPVNGIATFQFNVPATATYNIWIRVLAPTSNDNDMYIRTDASSYTSWTPGTYTSWTWKKWTSKSLTAGNHSVSIARKEDGLKLDKIMLTKGSSTPAGFGCPVSPAIPNAQVITEVDESGALSAVANELRLAPNPSNYSFTIASSRKAIEMILINNMLGQEVFRSTGIAHGEKIEFGTNFDFGIYNIMVKYQDGTTESLKILKTR